MTLYHYTCDHGAAALGVNATLLPTAALINSRRKSPPGRGWWPGRVVWLTDMERPEPWALGLTRLTLDCDRTAHRYRVLDESDAVRWSVYAHHLARDVRASLEYAHGARPAHWWVSETPVPAIYEPIGRT